MILKINGSPVNDIVKFDENGINVTFDLHDYFEVIHTPLNVDFSYDGHNIINGDVNLFNWAHSAIVKTGDIIGNVFDYVF